MTSEKQQIQDALSSKDPRYKIVKNANAKSRVWEVFAHIERDGEQINYVSCLRCQQILVYNPKTGTGSLIRHKCAVPASLPKQSKKTISDTKNDTSKRVLDNTARKRGMPKRALENLARILLSFVARDLQPLNITEGAGFRAYAQELINIGAEYGTQNFDDVSVFCKERMNYKIDSQYRNIKDQLQKALPDKSLAFAVDMWSDAATQRSHVGLSAHYITESFKLKISFLGIKEMPTETKSGEHILDPVKSILDEFNLNDKLQNSVFVTESEENAVKAFRHYNRLPCACHNLNVVIDDVLIKQPTTDIRNMIEYSRKLMQYFEHSGLNSKLSAPLKYEANKRWNSVFVMLNGITIVQQEIQILLLENNELERIDNLDFSLLDEVVVFLKPFKECSEKMSTETEPTVNIFVLWYEKLKNVCKPKCLDSEGILQLKNLTLTALQKRLKPTSVHLVGLFLNPLFREMHFLSAEDKEQVLSTVKSMLSDINGQTNGGSATEEVVPNLGDHEFAEFLDFTQTKRMKLEKNSIDLEIDNYFSSSANFEMSVLEFWENATHLSLLQKLAKQVLNVPVSSATRERIFSSCGLMFDERRTRFQSRNLDKILFLHKNMQS